MHINVIANESCTTVAPGLAREPAIYVETWRTEEAQEQAM